MYSTRTRESMQQEASIIILGILFEDDKIDFYIGGILSIWNWVTFGAFTSIFLDAVQKLEINWHENGLSWIADDFFINYARMFFEDLQNLYVPTTYEQIRLHTNFGFWKELNKNGQNRNHFHFSPFDVGSLHDHHWHDSLDTSKSSSIKGIITVPSVPIPSPIEETTLISLDSFIYFLEDLHDDIIICIVAKGIGFMFRIADRWSRKNWMGKKRFWIEHTNLF
ncbi:hypothetical protein ACJX0J_012361 [Zea mays]